MKYPTLGFCKPFPSHWSQLPGKVWQLAIITIHGQEYLSRNQPFSGLGFTPLWWGSMGDGPGACSAWLHRWLCLRPDAEGGPAAVVLAPKFFVNPVPFVSLSWQLPFCFYISTNWRFLSRVWPCPDAPCCRGICIFFLLTLSLLLFSLLIFIFSLTLSISAFHLSILSEVWLLNFLRLCVLYFSLSLSYIYIYIWYIYISDIYICICISYLSLSLCLYIPLPLSISIPLSSSVYLSIYLSIYLFSIYLSS